MRSKSRNERTTDNTSNKEIVFSSNRLKIILLFHVCTRFRLLNALSQFISHKTDGTFLNEIIIIIAILCTHRPMRPFLNEKVLVIPWRSQTVPIEILERNIISQLYSQPWYFRSIKIRYLCFVGWIVLSINKIFYRNNAKHRVISENAVA